MLPNLTLCTRQLFSEVIFCINFHYWLALLSYIKIHNRESNLFREAASLCEKSTVPENSRWK
jgi:hypothetical protein